MADVPFKKIIPSVPANRGEPANPPKPAAKDDCPQRGYMDACMRGDAVGMKSACDTMSRDRVVR